MECPKIQTRKYFFQYKQIKVLSYECSHESKANDVQIFTLGPLRLGNQSFWGDQFLVCGDNAFAQPTKESLFAALTSFYSAWLEEMRKIPSNSEANT